MLTVPLDCPFLIAHSVFSNIYLSCVLCTQCWQYLWIIHSWSPSWFSLTSTWPVSCEINVATAYGLSIFDCPFGFLKRLFVLCLAYSMLPVSLHCPFLIATSVFSIVYLSYVLCTQCWQCLWIVHSWLPIRFSLIFICPLSCVFNGDKCLCIIHSWLSPRFSLTFICPLSCVLNVDSTSGLSILGRSLRFL